MPDEYWKIENLRKLNREAAERKKWANEFTEKIISLVQEFTAQALFRNMVTTWDEEATIREKEGIAWGLLGFFRSGGIEIADSIEADYAVLAAFHDYSAI